MSTTYAVVPAAGRGVRMGGDRPKQFLDLSRKPILLHTLHALSRAVFLSGIILAVPQDYVNEVERLLEGERGQWSRDIPISVIAGGAERQDSVYNSLERLPAECEWVLIHDGVRPFASVRLMEETWTLAREMGAAIAALPATDTVKRVSGNRVVETLPREAIRLVQTPQVFRKDALKVAYDEARRQGWSATDDAGLMERIGMPVGVVVGERFNIKVTTPEDLLLAECLLKEK
ncbi:MAG: 2-C-methyl-D-erythritol 4-phosphate cytidylyltransferase [Syntrophobacteraceae bacterium]